MISDDASGPEASAALERLTEGDPPLSRPPLRRARSARTQLRPGAGAGARPMPATSPSATRTTSGIRAQARTLVGALGDGARWRSATCVVTRPDGTAISDTYWTTRLPNHDNFASLLLGNSVTGAAAAVPARPARPTRCRCRRASATSTTTTGWRWSPPRPARIAYVDRPLYDYVQHADAVIGHAGANRGVVGGSLSRRLAALRGRRPGRLRDEWRRIYFAEYCRHGADGRGARAAPRRGSIDPDRRRALDLALAARPLPRRARVARRRASCAACAATTPAAARPESRGLAGAALAWRRRPLRRRPAAGVRD